MWHTTDHTFGKIHHINIFRPEFWLRQWGTAAETLNVLQADASTLSSGSYRRRKPIKLLCTWEVMLLSSFINCVSLAHNNWLESIRQSVSRMSVHVTFRAVLLTICPHISVQGRTDKVKFYSVEGSQKAAVDLAMEVLLRYVELERRCDGEPQMWSLQQAKDEVVQANEAVVQATLTDRIHRSLTSEHALQRLFSEEDEHASSKIVQ